MLTVNQHLNLAEQNKLDALIDAVYEDKCKYAPYWEHHMIRILEVNVTHISLMIGCLIEEGEFESVSKIIVPQYILQNTSMTDDEMLKWYKDQRRITESTAKWTGISKDKLGILGIATLIAEWEIPAGGVKTIDWKNDINKVTEEWDYPPYVNFDDFQPLRGVPAEILSFARKESSHSNNWQRNFFSVKAQA